jgi:dimethylhistidine N-methyltransferase
MMENHESDFFDYGMKTNSVLREVLVGLSQTQKSLSPKLLYDKKGSEIFEEICKLDEYYPTRAETEILQDHGFEMSDLIGENALIIEPGSGSGEKVRFLFDHLEYPAGYVPMEISKEILLRMTDEIHEEYPQIKVLPVCADFMQDIELPLSVDSHHGKKVIFFPGSTIGNLAPAEAVGFLKKFGKMIGEGGGVLIGVDLKKDSHTFKMAYDDPKGVTAEFNLNLLERLNREIDAGFERNNFNHTAFYNEDLGRVEMHLVSRVPQFVKVNQTIFRFREGETIHTESSYKYTVAEFTELCAKAKLTLKQHWMDRKRQFCVYYFERD